MTMLDARPSTVRDLLAELEPTAAAGLEQHLRVAQEWMPHEYVPWSEGRDFVGPDGQAWEPEQSRLSETARIAFEVGLLTEDNLPSYHREITTQFGRDGAWGTWVHRWTAEEGRHGIAMRDFLLVTRGVDPVELERMRMTVMEQGYAADDKAPLQAMAYVSFQELATRLSHRNTGRYTDDPLAEKLLSRIATDENLHMVFYRGLVSAALEIVPDETMVAIRDEVVGFEMPGATIPDFGRKASKIAKAGIYDLRIHHDNVVMPLLRHWDFFERSGLSAEGEAAREQVSAYLAGVDKLAKRQESRYAEERASVQV